MSQNHHNLWKLLELEHGKIHYKEIMKVFKLIGWRVNYTTAYEALNKLRRCRRR